MPQIFHLFFGSPLDGRTAHGVVGINKACADSFKIFREASPVGELECKSRAGRRSSFILDVLPE